MRTSPLPPLKPGQIMPSRGTANDILRQLNSLGAGGGAGMANGPMGLFTPPSTPTWIYTEITDNDDPTGMGLHAHQQIEFEQLGDGTWISSTNGVTGTLTDNPLKELNGRAIPVGEVVRAELGTADKLWITAYNGDGDLNGSGSGSGGTFSVTCGDGTTTRYTLSNTGSSWTATEQ